MSGYLTRLVTRARESDKRQLLRPFVRSSSPIAEHDQRIGMADSEGFEHLGAPPDPTGSEGAVGPLADFQTPSRPAITPTSEMSGTTIQRKMAGPSPHAASAQPSVTGERMRSGRHTSMPEIPVGERSSSPGVMETRNRVGWLRGLTHLGVAGETTPLTDKPSGSRHGTSLEPTSILEEAGMLGDKSSVSSAESRRQDATGHDELATHDTHRQARRVIVDTRSARPARGVDSPRLEPAAHPFTERFEPSPSDAAASAVELHESPRVVIGRINVEVVQPSVAQPGTAAPRAGPLTAASASVIGPLGGGVRPNLRLSLRYR